MAKALVRSLSLRNRSQPEQCSSHPDDMSQSLFSSASTDKAVPSVKTEVTAGQQNGLSHGRVTRRPSKRRSRSVNHLGIMAPPMSQYSSGDNSDAGRADQTRLSPYYAGKESDIGTALGSPNHKLQRVHAANVQNFNSAKPNKPSKGPSSPRAQDTTPPPRETSSSKNTPKWRFFGGLFGKKPITPEDTPVTQPLSRQSPSSSRTASPMLNKRLPTPPTSPEDTVTPIRRHRSKRVQGCEPIVPVVDRTPKKYDSAQGQPIMTPKILTPESESPPERSPLLQVEIPNIELERYSVMFGSLLNPASASLLTRRQATLSRLNTTAMTRGRTEKKQETGREQLSMSSQQVTSPEMSDDSDFSLESLAPPSFLPPSNVSSRRPSPLRRSLTAPSGSISPAVASPTFGLHHMAGVEEEPAVEPERPPPPVKTSADSARIAQTKPKRPHLPKSESWSAQSPVATQPRGGSDALGSPRNREQRHSYESTIGKLPSPSKDPASRSAVEASIARQISVSQKRRIRSGKTPEERLVPHQPLTARLVDIKHGPAGRKSLHGELVAAGE